MTLIVTPAQQAALAAELPLIGNMAPVDGRATAYLCRHFTCQPPMTAVDVLERELAKR
jgi:uncharacterized protein YyaL (SSP411 family)